MERGQDNEEPKNTPGEIPCSRRRLVACTALVILAVLLLLHEILVPYRAGLHLLSSVIKLTGLAALFYVVRLYRPNPLTRKKLRRFYSIKRGYISFVVLLGLLLISLFGRLLVNDRAIVVKYEGKYYFPTYTAFKSGELFGEDYSYETKYRELQQRFRNEDADNWVLIPPVPYDEFENDFRDGVRHPSPPNISTRHFLGTDKTGRDILARLFYGFRIAMVFSLVFMFCVYVIGIAIGCAMGYFGGKTDLLGQRLVEIWSIIPFLYMVIITVSLVPPGLGVPTRIALLLVVMVLFSWTSMTYYMRTATYKEKARDYTAAARLLGASTSRIIFGHILPNTVSTIVTFMPFTVASAIISITALDFLGFGLPSPTPSWGELLRQGIGALHAPWIVTSAFFAMVAVLTLVTFIGEAIREAFDPRKFTVYQ